MSPTNSYPHWTGTGTSSVVWRISPDRVAKCHRPGQLCEIEHEHRILERLGQHPLIIKSFGLEAGQLFLEYHPRELRNVLLSRTHIHREKWALQIAEVLFHVHAKNIIHRDLNSRNIRIQVSEDIVLCDFAGSSLDGLTATGVRGEVRFCRLPYHSMATVQDDLFALGSVLYELSTGSVPYATLEDKEVIRRYSDKIFPPVDHLPMGKIITNCWNDSYQYTNEVLFDLV
jgi:serine/threonine protein kinase